VQLTDIGESFMVEVGTDKGTHFVESMGDVFEPATDEDIKKGEDIKTQAEKAIQQHMNTEDIVERLEGIFESPFWKNVAAKCLGCAACTYVCPTCHCFDMQDETAGGEGARIRVWDSCMYPEYTQHASGHNPRPARMNRIRNRVYHKFSYYPKNWSMLGCVGCGRCIEACPVNIDIIDVVNTTSEVNP
jgi:ferredoxin